jgi:hypothetical protein
MLGREKIKTIGSFSVAVAKLEIKNKIKNIFLYIFYLCVPSNFFRTALL